MAVQITLTEVRLGDIVELFSNGTPVPVRVTKGAHRPFGNNDVRIQYENPGLPGGFNYTGRADEPIRKTGTWRK